MAKRLVLEQHDLCTIWSTENIVSGLMEENGLLFFFFLSPKDISVSLLDAKFPVFFYTKRTAAGVRQCCSSCPGDPALAMNYRGC